MWWAAHRKSSRSMHIYSHSLLWNPEINQYLFKQDHFVKRTTWSGHVISLTSEPCELYVSLQDQRDICFLLEKTRSDWQHGKGVTNRKAGSRCCPLLCTQDKTMVGKWTRNCGLKRDSAGRLFLDIYSLHKLKMGKRKEKKGKLHSHLVLKRKNSLF